MDPIKELAEFVERFSAAPTLEAMPRRTLEDKGIAGPTGAHVIEELHTPFNLAYVTCTTGSTAFQNITGVTAQELPDRIAASHKALRLCGIRPGARLLFAYPPLVSVFPREALDAYEVSWSFLQASSRDALLLALCRDRPDVVVGESSFLRAALEDSRKMGISGLLPRDTVFLAAGTPLDSGLITVVRSLTGGSVHDLYGCQEFGWLTLDGIPLREDISLLPTEQDSLFDLVVGGLPTGDRFPVTGAGHACNPEGKILTCGRVRSARDLEVTILETSAAAVDTVERLCRTVLRIKSRIVRPSHALTTKAERTLLSLAPWDGSIDTAYIEGPEKTRLLDSLLQAQMDYQARSKTDPAWIKKR